MSRRVSKMRAADISLGQYDRQIVGAIVTAREQESDRREVYHRAGSPHQAVGEICAILDGKEGDWRVLSISTPSSIYRDLQGDRKEVGTDRMIYPEQRYLRRLGREDLLDPSLLPRSAKGRSVYPKGRGT